MRGKLGMGGAFINNIRRDLCRYLIPRSFLPAPYMLRVPYSNHQGDRLLVQFTNVPIILPHDLLDSLFHNCRSFFDKLVRGNRAFWDCVRDDDPKLQDHPMTRVANWRNIFFPMVIFGDTVRYTTGGNSLHVTCWSSMLYTEWHWLATFLAVVMAKLSCCTQHLHGTSTMHEIWKLLRESFAHCLPESILG